MHASCSPTMMRSSRADCIALSTDMVHAQAWWDDGGTQGMPEAREVGIGCPFHSGGSLWDRTLEAGFSSPDWRGRTYGERQDLEEAVLLLDLHQYSTPRGLSWLSDVRLDINLCIH